MVAMAADGVSYGSTRRERYEYRRASLRAVRATWEPAWKDILEQLNPYGVLWDRFKRNRGDKEESRILNNTPVLALSILAAGMMAWLTSPARDWFGIGTVDPDLAKWRDAKRWLDRAEEVVKARLERSGWYTALSDTIYMHLGSIGQGLMLQEDNGTGRTRYDARPVGEYCLDQDHENKIDTCYRELDMTVRGVVGKFGRDACSQTVRKLWDESKYDVPVPVVQAIQPNEQYTPGRLDARWRRWASCWWDSNDDRKTAFLRESGYNRFPALAPRWSVRAGDVYGRGPGWSARGDCRLLQLYEKRKLRILDKIDDPPMKRTQSIGRSSMLPGDFTELPEGANVVFEPAIDLAPLATALNYAMQHIEAIEGRVNKTFHVDLWQAFINDERAQRQTATEVDAKREERMLILGPLLENLNLGLFEPAIEGELELALRSDELEPPPEELLHDELKPKFTSIMHQAQQVTGLAAVRTFVAEIGSLAQLRPEVIQKVNADVIADEVLRITGLRGDALLSDDELKEVRRQQAEEAQAKKTGEAMIAATQGARNLAGVDPQKLSEVAASITPAAQAQAGVLPSAAGS